MIPSVCNLRYSSNQGEISESQLILNKLIKMIKSFFSKIKPIFKPLLVLTLIFTMVLSNAHDALAARSGGRIGGGSFRAPTRTYSAPQGGYSGGYGYGGGFGFPFLLPFFGFGGGFGGLFSILIVIAIANFLIKSFRNATSEETGDNLGYSNPQVSVAQVQVGLLANARYLQPELNQLAMRADMGTASGRARVLQETSLALLRHPEYWVYGTAEAQKTALNSAEAKFNQFALSERSKFTAETLTNVENQLSQAANRSSSTITTTDNTETGEYIIVTLIVGAEGKLELPKINGSEDLQQALRQIGSIGSDRLLAVEILWTPQAEGDTLTTDDILANYPNLKLV